MKILDKTIEECEAQENQVLAGQTRPNAAAHGEVADAGRPAEDGEVDQGVRELWAGVVAGPGGPEAEGDRRRGAAFLKDFEDPQYQREAVVKLQMGKLNMAKGDIGRGGGEIRRGPEGPGDRQAGAVRVDVRHRAGEPVAKKARPGGGGAGRRAEVGRGQLPGGGRRSSSRRGGAARLSHQRAARQSRRKNAEEKRKFAEAGDAALSKVMADNPRPAPAIKRMMLEKLPVDADLTKLDTVVLQSLMAPGVDEVMRREGGRAPDERASPSCGGHAGVGGDAEAHGEGRQTPTRSTWRRFRAVLLGQAGR